MAYRLSCDLSEKIVAFGSVCGNMYLIDDDIDCTEQDETFQLFIFMVQ